ncbi:hypothetical protein M9H77_11301 [Catharanthus roseus]|uniref:Uncharacterized protein n=1 Tax=Catharanthus roseus TaxID=4058 RepID=A0ACC0BE75_CATRO|nr:hypothetical protein M9H77_11301 [Catharanthus roseus]
MWVVPVQKIYNVITKIKRNRIQEQNTIEEVQYTTVGSRTDDSNSHERAKEDELNKKREVVLGVRVNCSYKDTKVKRSGLESGSGSGSGSGSSSGFHGRGRPPRAPRGRGRGRSRGRSSLSSIIDPSPCSTFPYTDAFSTFIYLFIENWKNIIGDRNCGYRVVADFVFSNERGTLVIGLLIEQQHFIQLQMNYRCPIPSYMCNEFITIVIESVRGQRVIMKGLPIGT